MATKKIRREPLLAPDGSGLQSTYYTGLLFGPNGCGKTSVAEQIVRYYVHLGGKVWAIDPNGAWEEVRDVKSLWTTEEGVDEILISSEDWGPGLMVFDDMDKYARYATEIQKNYLTSNRHLRKDQLVLSRRPQGIPKDAIAIAHFICLFAGALIEPGAHKYFAEIFPDEILDAVPTREFHYLLIMRQGGRWQYERRKSKPRTIRNKSDKS